MSKLEKVKKVFSNAASLLLILFYIIESIIGTNLDAAIAVCMALIFFSCVAFMKGSFKSATWVFGVISCMVLLICQAPIDVWCEGFNRMLASIVILFSAQGLAIAIQLGNYNESVSDYLQKNVRKAFGFFCLLLVLSHVLAGTMTLGAIIIIFAAIYPLMKKILPDDCHEFLANSVGVGYVALLVWAPGSVTAIMSTSAFGVSWSSYFIPAFLLALLELAVAAGYGYIKYKRKSFVLTSFEEKNSSFQNNRNPLHLVIVLAIIVALILLLEKINFSSSTGRMVISTVVVSVVWMFYIDKKEFKAVFLQTLWDEKIPGNIELATFFIAMGLFSEAISYIGIEGWLTTTLQSFSRVLNVGVIALLPMLMILVSLIGVHPFITILMVCPILYNMNLAVSPIQLSMAAAIGTAISFLVSPFTGSVLVLASLLETPATKVSYKYNLIPSILFYIVGVGYIYLLSLFL